MNGYDWPDTESDFDLPDWGDAELFPSPSLALARGLINRARSGRRPPSVVSRPGGRPPTTTAPVPPVLRDELQKVYETMKRLEQKQDEQTRQLALLQVRTSGQQTGEVFRQALTSGVLNALPALNQRDLVTGIAQFVPALQAWQGLGPSVSSKPFSTFAFPLGTAVALFLLRRPPKPTVTANRYTGVTAASPATVTLYPSLGLALYWTTGAGAPVKGAAGTTEYAGPFQITAPAVLRVKAQTLFGIESDHTEVVFT
jgi:hypothetical protein